MLWCYILCFLCAFTSSSPLSLDKSSLIFDRHFLEPELQRYVTSTNLHWACVVDYGPFPLLESILESQQWEQYKADAMDDLRISEETLRGPPARYAERELLPCEDCGCGERNEEGRVVGGTESNVNAFPWLGRLVYEKAFGCASSLINDKFVISAAHCVKGFMWFLFRVKFGEHNRCEHTQAETRRVVKIIAHSFSLSDLSNDIALLKLNKPVEYNHAIRPVCLPKNDDSAYTGRTAVVAGWGAINETGKWSCTVLEAELPVLSNEACRSTNYNASKIKDVMMCAGFPETAHKDACTGDSGGPLITENEEHMYDLIGVVSWGYGCARKGYPGVYTRVTKYLDWIRDNTREGCYCKY